MAKLHIIAGSGSPDTFHVVIHVATPTGNNQAGIPWTTVLKNSGLARTRMPEGNGPGQITHQELSKIEDGEIIEAELQFTIEPNWTTQERLAALDALVISQAAEMIQQLRDRFRWFGSIRT